MSDVINVFAMDNLKISLDNYFLRSDHLKDKNIRAIFIAQVESALLIAALKSNGYNQFQTAKTLGMNRMTLANRMKDYGISKPSDDEDIKENKFKDSMSDKDIDEETNELDSETI